MGRIDPGPEHVPKRVPKHVLTAFENERTAYLNMYLEKYPDNQSGARYRNLKGTEHVLSIY